MQTDSFFILLFSKMQSINITLFSFIFKSRKTLQTEHRLEMIFSFRFFAAPVEK